MEALRLVRQSVAKHLSPRAQTRLVSFDRHRGAREGWAAKHTLCFAPAAGPRVRRARGPPCLRFFPSLRGKRIALILEWQLLSLAFF